MAFLKPNYEYDLWDGEGLPKDKQYFNVGKATHQALSSACGGERNSYGIWIQTLTVRKGVKVKNTFKNLAASRLRKTTYKEARRLDETLEAIEVLSNL